MIRTLKNIYYSRYKLHTIQWYEGVYIRSYWKLNEIKVEPGLLRIPIRYVRNNTLDTVQLLLPYYREAKAKSLK